MRHYFVKHRSFLLFLARFFGSYFVFATLYQCYLLGFDELKFEVDFFTKTVSSQSVYFLKWIDTSWQMANNLEEPCMNILYNNEWISRIVEGCNGLSIMILFASFVLAFYKGFKATFSYIVFGVLIIHVFNILRIVGLNLAMIRFKKYTDFLHNILFPLVIYGIVFLLWFFWVNKFSKDVKK